MILYILRFLRGYISVRFEGVSSEKILSRLAEEKISVWQLKYSGGCIYGKMFAKDFKRMPKIKKNTAVKIKIIKKHGFPFFWKKYNRRTGFIFGAVIIFALLKFLSTFIWIINVEGNEKIRSSDILNSLNSIGIVEKMKVTDIDAKLSAQRLLLERNDLSWASLNVEGCVLNVEVREIEEKPNTDDGLPSNLIASRDGTIKKIEAVSGDVKVKLGENVHRGDLLVSGVIESLTSTAFVKSNAVISAQVEEKYTDSDALKKSIKLKTGSQKRNVVLEILGVRIPLFLPEKTKNADVTYRISQAVFTGKKIPLTLYSKNLSFYQKMVVSTDEDVLKERLAKRLNEYLEKNKIDGYIPIGTEYYTDDDGVTISHRYLCDVNIAMENKIILGQ